MNREKVLKAFFWKFAERGSTQAISFVISLILARLLSPSDYGQVAILMIFISVLQVLVDSGFGNALIQKKDATKDDFSTILYFNILLSIALYIILFIAAPYISSFFRDDYLIDLIRVLGIILVISGVRNVQQAYVSKKMEFRIFFFSNLWALIISALIGIVMAYCGYGVWALIVQSIISCFLGTISLWYMSAWRPKLCFKMDSFKGLFAFGSRLLVAGLCDIFYNNLRQLVIGRMYTASDLAFYNQGEKFPALIVTNINTSISSVLFPAMSATQDVQGQIKNMVRRSVQVASFFMWPLMIMLVVIAEPLVRIILTEKWLPLVPYLQICCFTYVLWPIHTANLNGINALGRSDVFLRLEIIKKAVGVVVLLPTVFIGPLAICLGAMIVSFISSVINAYPNRKLLEYSYKCQIIDIMPSMIMSLLMGIEIYQIYRLNYPDIVTVILQVILGLISYSVMAFMSKNSTMEYIFLLIKSRL